MAHSKKTIHHNKVNSRRALLAMSVFSLLCVGGFSIFHMVSAHTPKASLHATTVSIDPNFSIKTRTIQFLEDNKATALIPIIKCESHFKHYESDGTVLKNREGSSAIGVAQILSSQHPDPKIIQVYNRRNNTDFTTDDFNLNTYEGNIGYALVLFKVRGIQDWECARHIRQ